MISLIICRSLNLCVHYAFRLYMPQNTEVFTGNVYIAIPSFLDDKSCSYLEFSDKAKAGDIENDTLTAELTKRFSSEISSDVHKSIKRFCLGEYELACFDQFECGDENQCYKKASLYISIHNRTCLGVVTLLLHNQQLAASQLLDRVSQDNVIVRSADGSTIKLKDILAQKFNIITFTNAAKVCLSTREMIPESILPYYFANETFNSNDMRAQIVSNEFKDQMSKNIAQYNSSDLFIGRNSVLRIDKREGQHLYPELHSDSTFIFIIEALLFKEAAVLRTNKQILQAIGKTELLSLETMDKVTSEFAVTMPFWDIRIFKYLTAQQLANHLEKSFGIDQHFELYEKNQQFLQHKINIRQGIEDRSKNKVLYLVAIILFIFEIAPYLFKLFNRLLDAKWLSSTEMFALLGAGSSTGLITLVIVFIIKMKKQTK
jgi:hypothetical protein